MSSLLDKASILLTPTGYNTSEMLCIKPNTSVGDFDFSRSTTATRVNSSGFIESVANNIPRINYLEDSCGSWLLEPPSVNYTKDSEQPSTWHSDAGVTITANAITSPEGTANASLVVINAITGPRYVRNRAQFPPSSLPEEAIQTVTCSCFLKRYEEQQWVRLKSVFFNGSPANNESSFFDIQNGLIGTVGANHTAKMENYGNNWYRCSITFDIDTYEPGGGDPDGYMHVEFAPNDNTSGFAVPGKGAYVFGSQGEELPFASSYMPAGASVAVRNKDIAKQAGDSSLINSDEGTLYIEFKAPTAIPPQFTRLMSVSDGASGDQNAVLFMRLGAESSSSPAPNKLRAQVKVGSVGKLSVDWTIGDITSYNKIAFRYKSGESKVFVNGAQQGSTKTSTFTLPTLDRFNLCNATGSENFEGNIKCAALFTEALSDVELACLTS